MMKSNEASKLKNARTGRFWGESKCEIGLCTSPVLAAEFINATSGIQQLLLAGVKRMTL